MLSSSFILFEPVKSVVEEVNEPVLLLLFCELLLIWFSSNSDLIDVNERVDWIVEKYCE